MKALGRFFLTLHFVLVFIALLFAITFKFQLLDSKFWVQTFNKYQIYGGLQKGIEKAISEQVIKGGGSAQAAKIVTNTLKAQVLQDLLEKNITHLTKFLNGEEKSLVLYVPIKSFPPGFLPKNLAIKNDEINLENFTSNLNTAPGQGPINYKQLASTGTLATISLLISIFFVCLGLWGFYKSNDPGTNLIFPGVAIIIAALTSLILIGALNIFRLNIVSDLSKDGVQPAQILLATLAPPIILEVSKLWAIICGATIALGIGVLFIKKPN